MKKLLVFATLCLSFAQLASAATACRDFRAGGPGQSYQALPVKSAVIAVDRSITASLTWPSAESRGSTFALKGTLCGPDLAPLSNRTIDIVRLEVGERDLTATTALSSSVVDNSTKLERYSVVTSDKGKFALTGLAPGTYALVVDWNEIETEVPVVFDLTVLPGFRSFLPRADATVGEVDLQ